MAVVCVSECLFSSLQMSVSSAAVGSIVGWQSAAIQQMASEYEEKVGTLKNAFLLSIVRTKRR